MDSGRDGETVVSEDEYCMYDGSLCAARECEIGSWRIFMFVCARDIGMIALRSRGRGGCI